MKAFEAKTSTNSSDATSNALLNSIDVRST